MIMEVLHKEHYMMQYKNAYIVYTMEYMRYTKKDKET